MPRRYKKKSYKKRKSSRSRRTRYSRRSLRKTVTRILNQKSETKTFIAAAENAQLFHNIDFIPVLDPYQNLIKGTGGNQRIGDRITSRGIKFKLFLTNKSDRPNITYRVTIGTVPQSINNVLINTGNLTGYLWQQADAGACGNTLILTHKKETGIRIIYDKLLPNKIGYSEQSHRLVVGAGGCEHHKVLKYWMRPKRGGIVQYTDGQNNSKGRWIFMCITAYDSFGTLITDNIASFAITYQMYFKDF